MGLRRMRDTHGRMYEVPLVIMVVLLGLAIGIPRGGVMGILSGLLIAAVFVFGILLALVLLGLAADTLSEVRWLSAVAEKPLVKLARASFVWVLMFLFFGGVANLIAFVLLEGTSFSPGMQAALSAGVGILAGGLGTVLIYRFNRKNTPRF